MQPKLFLAGPTEVKAELRQVLAQPMIGHRGQEYSKLQERIVTKLRQFAGSKHEVLLFTSSATGVMEAAIRNCVSNKVLHTTCGAFSERWADISRSCGKNVSAITCSPGKAIRPAELAAALSAEHYDAVTITHNETSTGVLNPLAELCATARRVSPDTLILVDAVSSFAGTVIQPDEFGIDVLLFGTQKCLALPPGLGIAMVSERALAVSVGAVNKGYYFDFLEMLKYARKNQTPATPAISLMYALDVQLEAMIVEGMVARAKRHEAMAQLVRSWVKAKGWTLLAEAGYESPTVTAAMTGDSVSSEALRAAVKTRGYALADGYGVFKGKGFRVGHMGDWTPADVIELLKAMDEALASLPV